MAPSARKTDMHTRLSIRMRPLAGAKTMPSLFTAERPSAGETPESAHRRTAASTTIRPPTTQRSGTPSTSRPVMAPAETTSPTEYAA